MCIFKVQFPSREVVGDLQATMDVELKADASPAVSHSGASSTKPSDFRQATLEDMKGAVWTSRVPGHPMPAEISNMLLAMGWKQPEEGATAAATPVEVAKATAPTPGQEVAAAAAATAGTPTVVPEVAKAAVPTPVSTPAPEVAAAAAAAPTVVPEVAKAAMPTPEPKVAAAAAAPTVAPEVAKAATPTPEPKVAAAAAAPTVVPEVAKAAVPTPEPKVAAAAAAHSVVPEVPRVAAPTPAAAPSVVPEATPPPQVAAMVPQVAKAAAPAPEPSVPTDPLLTAKVEQTFAPRPPATPAMAPATPLTQNALMQLQQQQLKKQQNGLGLQNVPDPNQKEYTRRAAANLIQRLKDNPSRMKSLPALEKMVNDESKKSELITMLCESQGAFERVGANLQAYEEHMEDQSFKKKALRWTKKEMEDHYGADAEKTMKHKQETGMVEEDENCPGAVLYLVSRKVDEVATHTRHGILALP